MKVSHDLQLYKQQRDFLEATEKIVAFIAGIGSGKTHTLALWILKTALEFPKSKGLIVANTYEQLTTATLRHVSELLDKLEIDYSLARRQGSLILNINGGADIYCRSLEKAENIRGIEVGWIAADELAFSKQSAFEIIIGRLRDREGPLKVRISTSPNGFNWLQELLTERGRVIRASSLDNPFLPEGYVETLAAQYDEKFYRQEILGEFIDTTSGAVYYNFKRKNTQDLAHIHPTTVYVGTDFNVSPITSVLGHWDGKTLFINDEIFLRDSNTFELAEKIIQKADGRKVICCPDATGRARKTSSKTTDHHILRNAGMTVRTGSVNPSVKDRYNAVNLALHRGTLVVDSKCKWLIKDLEQMTWQNKDPDISHISDALGYLVWNLMPLRLPKKPAPKNIVFEGY